MAFPETLKHEDGALAAAIEAVRDLPRGTRRGLLVIEKIDGAPAGESALLDAFAAAGYAFDYRGLIDVRPAVSGAPRDARR